MVLLIISLLTISFSSALNIHIIPHTHADPSWLLTFDEYYKRYVSDILNNVVGHLIDDPSKRFAWAETCYLHRYYHSLAPAHKDFVKKLI